MSGLGHTARGLFVACLALTALVATTLTVVRRWPLVPPQSVAAPAPVVSAIEPCDETIRVALTRRPVRSVEVRIDGAFQIVSLSEPRSVERFSTSLQSTRVAFEDDGLEIGGRPANSGGVELVPERSPGVWINGRKYRGVVRLHVTDSGRLWPVNVLPREEYLAAVVDAEMPAAFPNAAREAQAIVARTYAISCQQNPPHRWFDLFSTPVSQNYLGVVYRDAGDRLLAGETASGRAAAEETKDIVCTYQGQLFRTYYSACCGGTTLSGAVVFADETPALDGVTCGGCNDAPLYRWERIASDPSALERVARTRSPSFRSLRSASTTDRPNAPGLVSVSDGRRTVRLTASEVKSALGLPSLIYKLKSDESGIVTHGRGHGHGVGLCQWGAKGLAEQGYTAEQILKHYYPGSDLTQLP